MTLLRKVWERSRDLFPVTGFHFDRPLVLLQSDDWGRVGLRDQEGLEELRAAGLALGERAYDFYTLETADDVAALIALLKRHHDASGRCPGIEMNFVPCNLDFARMQSDDYRNIHLLPLADGWPQGWQRPALLESYREAIGEGLIIPALHGNTHFCRQAVEHALDGGDGIELVRKLWRAGTPYIHWRMPWIGYEYWDPGNPEDSRFLPAQEQRELIGQTVGAFAKLFSTLPRSACAPGYRANDDTHRAWAQHGIRVAQNGPGALIPPHFDRHEILHLYRTVEFEPAVDPLFSVEKCLRHAETCFERGIPAIVSIHSINFHSTVRDFRSGTLRSLDQFFTALESRHENLLYLHDEDICDLVHKGSYTTLNGIVQMQLTQKKFKKRQVAQQGKE